mmetsp:Transcript_50499/g.70050  ORF Transcript_50499/g.70050 Transcript_50499/m.70050 type:complete len:248 (+) Transcript_50499:108-851(+)
MLTTLLAGHLPLLVVGGFGFCGHKREGIVFALVPLLGMVHRLVVFGSIARTLPWGWEHLPLFIRARYPFVAGVQEGLIREQVLLLLVLVFLEIPQDLSVDLPGLDLVRNSLDELLHRKAELPKEDRQVSRDIYLRGLLDLRKHSSHPCSPALHVLGLQSCFLKLDATSLLLFDGFVELLLGLLQLLAQCHRAPALDVVDRQSFHLLLQLLVPLSQQVQVSLRLLDRVLQTLVLHLTIQKLVNDVHDI